MGRLAWTLSFEFFCYLSIAAVAITAILHHPRIVLALWVFSWLTAISAAFVPSLTTLVSGLPFEILGHDTVHTHLSTPGRSSGSTGAWYGTRGSFLLASIGLFVVRNFSPQSRRPFGTSSHTCPYGLAPIYQERA